MDALHESLSAALQRIPFQRVVIDTTDGRRIEIGKPDQALLNAVALSVCEAPFSVTVIGLEQIREVILPAD